MVFVGYLDPDITWEFRKVIMGIFVEFYTQPPMVSYRCIAQRRPLLKKWKQTNIIIKT